LQQQPEPEVIPAEWKRASGNARWDDSVGRNLKRVSDIGRKPPAGFPDRFIVRFDVQDDSEIARR